MGWVCVTPGAAERFLRRALSHAIDHAWRQVLQIAIVLGFFRRRRRIDFGFGAPQRPHPSFFFTRPPAVFINHITFDYMLIASSATTCRSPSILSII
jgi:hypothetical protein